MENLLFKSDASEPHYRAIHRAKCRKLFTDHGWKFFMGGAYAEKSIFGRSAMAVVTTVIDDWVLWSFHWSDSLVRGSYGGLPIPHILVGKGDMKWA